MNSKASKILYGMAVIAACFAIGYAVGLIIKHM